MNDNEWKVVLFFTIFAVIAVWLINAHNSDLARVEAFDKSIKVTVTSFTASEYSDIARVRGIIKYTGDTVIEQTDVTFDVRCYNKDYQIVASSFLFAPHDLSPQSENEFDTMIYTKNGGKIMTCEVTKR